MIEKQKSRYAVNHPGGYRFGNHVSRAKERRSIKVWWERVKNMTWRPDFMRENKNHYYESAFEREKRN